MCVCLCVQLVVIYNDHSLYTWELKSLSQIGKAYSCLYHNACIWDICVSSVTFHAICVCVVCDFLCYVCVCDCVLCVTSCYMRCLLSAVSLLIHLISYRSTLRM